MHAILETYTSMPCTPDRASRQDRRLATALHDHGVPLDLVLAAITVGAARRAFRNPNQPPLGPVRTLAYFLPVLDEMQAYLPEPGYVAYVRNKLAAL
jgi:hypothetical protein